MDKRASRAGKRGMFHSFEIKGVSAKAARAFSAGRVSKLVRRISRILAATSARVYGCASLSFGLLTLILHLGEYYIKEDPQVRLSSLVIGIIFIVLSMLLFLSDKPISFALQNNRLTDFIFFEFFSINRMQAVENERKIPLLFGVVFGFIPAVLGYFLPTEYVAFAIVALVFVVISFVSPEFPYIFSLLIFPYLSLIPYSNWLLAALVLTALVSFARKVLVGKRVYSLEIYDALLSLFVIAVMINGVILGGSESTEMALLILIFALGYIPATNIAVNRRLCDCVAGAMVASSVPISIYSIVKCAIGFAKGLPEPSLVWFESAASLAAYLSVVAMFSLYLFAERRRKIKKAYYFTVFLLAAVALVATQYFAIPIVIIISLVLLTVIRSKKLPKLLILPFIFLPLALYFLPSSALNTVSDFLGISPSLLSLRETLVEFFPYISDKIFLGMGGEAFLEGANPTFNTYLALIARFGIFATLIFFVMLLVRIRHLAVYRKLSDGGTVSFYVEMCSLASLAMLVFGDFADIFSNASFVYFFISVFAIGNAALRISKKERDLRHSYYKDSGSSEYAAIDVTLGEK